jgi:hypothetical protein
MHQKDLSRTLTCSTPSCPVFRRRCIRRSPSPPSLLILWCLGADASVPWGILPTSFAPARLVSRRHCINPVGYFSPSFPRSCLVFRCRCISSVGYFSPSFPPSCGVSAPMHQSSRVFLSVLPSCPVWCLGANASVPLGISLVPSHRPVCVSAPMHQSHRIFLSFPPSIAFVFRRRCISPIGCFSPSFPPSYLLSQRRCIRHFPSCPPRLPL